MFHVPLLAETKVNNDSKNAISPDGKLFVSASKWITTGAFDAQAQIRFWNLETGMEEGSSITVSTANKIPAVVFSSDGKVVGAYYCVKMDAGSQLCVDTEISLWDVQSHQLLGEISMQDVNALVVIKKDHLFSLDTKSVSEWTRTNSQFTQRKIGTGGSSLAISPDGKIAAVGYSGTVSLWDTTSGNSIGLPFSGDFGLAYSMDFSPDGQYLAVGTNSSRVFVWQVASAYWLERACQMTNRNLTMEEWQIYLGNEPYQKICADNP